MKRSPWQAALAQRWAALQERERLGLQVAVGLLGAYVIWAWAMAGLNTVSGAEVQRKRLETELQRMQTLSVQADVIRSEIKPVPKDWRQEFKQSLTALGQARLIDASGTLEVQLQGCDAQALGRWLAELAPRWRLQVSQASLRSDAQGLWQGKITLVAP